MKKLMVLLVLAFATVLECSAQKNLVTRGAMWSERPWAETICQGGTVPGVKVVILDQDYVIKFVSSEHNSKDINYIMLLKGDTTCIKGGKKYYPPCGNEIAEMFPISSMGTITVHDTAWLVYYDTIKKTDTVFIKETRWYQDDYAMCYSGSYYCTPGYYDYCNCWGYQPSYVCGANFYQPGDIVININNNITITNNNTVNNTVINNNHPRPHPHPHPVPGGGPIDPGNNGGPIDPGNNGQGIDPGNHGLHGDPADPVNGGKKTAAQSPKDWRKLPPQQQANSNTANQQQLSASNVNVQRPAQTNSNVQRQNPSNVQRPAQTNSNVQRQNPSNVQRPAQTNSNVQRQNPSNVQRPAQTNSNVQRQNPSNVQRPAQTNSNVQRQNPSNVQRPAQTNSNVQRQNSFAQQHVSTPSRQAGGNSSRNSVAMSGGSHR